MPLRLGQAVSAPAAEHPAASTTPSATTTSATEHRHLIIPDAAPDPSYARTLAFCRMVLAAGQHQGKDLEAGLTTTSLAIEDAVSLQPARVLRYVQDFQCELPTGEAPPAVTEFHAAVSEFHAAASAALSGQDE